MNKEHLQQYRVAVANAFAEIESQEPAFEAAAKVLARAIAGDQVVHVIGPGGHSNMAAEEVLWRAGGLAPINAILDPGTNLIHGAKRSNYIERTPGYASRVLDAYRVGLTPGEVIIIVNAYGINSMVIDTALEAKKRGMTSVGITSRGFADNLEHDHPSRHPSAKNLYQEVDHFLDCHVPYGDAAVVIAGSKQKTGPTATMCNLYTLNLLMVETVYQLVELGVEPPIWMSANLPGGDEANRANEEKYIPRVRHLG
ncbi:MAG: sugar isomerase domain-containing protein [Trueperaceae bacterium]